MQVVSGCFVDHSHMAVDIVALGVRGYDSTTAIIARLIVPLTCLSGDFAYAHDSIVSPKLLRMEHINIFTTN